MPGGAPSDRAGDREAENPETPPCEGGLSAASTAIRGASTNRSHRRRRATLAGERLTADAAPLSNASGSAPRGTGRQQTRTMFQKCQDYFLQN